MDPYLLHIGLFLVSLVLAAVIPEGYEPTVLLAVYLNYYLMSPMKDIYMENKEKDKKNN